MTIGERTRPGSGEHLGAAPSAPRLAESWGHRPALDGLRTIAVYLVVLFHSGIGWAGGGFIGVDLFFVLSGFLVTNVLLVEWDRYERVRLMRFYARRMRRLLPAAFTMIVVTAGMFVLVAPVTERLRMVADARASLLYAANWHFLVESTDYFAQADNPSPFLHFWSLAIEEQFYFIFPIVLVGLAVLARRSWAWMLPVGLATLFAVSLGLQWFWSSRDASHAYYGTDARLYQLLAGALLAATAVWWRDRTVLPPRWGGAAALAGVVAVVAASTTAFDVSPSTRGIVATMCSAAVIAGLEVRRDGLLPSFLARPTLTYLGKISYGTYLWHWPVIIVLQRLMTIGPVTTVVVASVVSTSFAALSAQLIELPIRRAPLLDRVPRHVVACGLAVTLLAALTIVPATLRSDRTPVVADGDESPLQSPSPIEGLDDPVPAGFDWAAIADDVGLYPDCTRADIEGCTIVPGNGFSLMVIGDSHAVMYRPMFEELAKRHGFELSMSAAGGCGWQEGVVNVASSDEGCAERQVGRYDEIVPAIDPDVVVLVSRGFGPELRREDRDAAADPDKQPLSMEQLVAETSTATVDRLVAEGRRVIILEPVPNPPDGRNMVDCLSGARLVGECAFTVTGDEPYEPIYRYLAMRSDQVVSIDLDPLVCPDAPVCVPIIDGEPVRKDSHHITTTFIRRRADTVWSQISGTGILNDLPAG